MSPSPSVLSLQYQCHRHMSCGCPWKFAGAARLGRAVIGILRLILVLPLTLCRFHYVTEQGSCPRLQGPPASALLFSGLLMTCGHSLLHQMKQCSNEDLLVCGLCSSECVVHMVQTCQPSESKEPVLVHFTTHFYLTQ
jgi:hypothetical protein